MDRMRYEDGRKPSAMPSVFEASGGREGLLRIAAAWHARVMADEVVSYAFSHGGPATYTDQHGDETAVVRMHSGNGRHEEMDRRAIACFDEALRDVGIADESLRQVLHDYFAWATTTTLARYHESADDVPEGLSVPRWSWGGPRARGLAASSLPLSSAHVTFAHAE